MPILTDFYRAQDFAGIQIIPMLFYPLNASSMTDGTQPGVWQPFRADEDGNLLVSLGGAGGGPILLPDNVDDVASVATASRVPTVARLYGLERASNEWDRLLTDDDDAENSFANEDNALLRVMNRGRLFSAALGDVWSREKGQDGIAVAASASRTVATTFGNFVNVNHRALHIIVGVTVIGADALTIDIEGRELFPPFSFYPLLTSLPISTTGVTVLKVGIGFTPVPNLTANNMITAVWRVVATPAGVDPITYSINANLSV
jgi:hypothetical protein